MLAQKVEAEADHVATGLRKAGLERERSSKQSCKADILLDLFCSSAAVT